jgi:hypothetical protein
MKERQMLWVSIISAASAFLFTSIVLNLEAKTTEAVMMFLCWTLGIFAVVSIIVIAISIVVAFWKEIKETKPFHDSGSAKLFPRFMEGAPHIVDEIEKIMADVPDEELKKLPTDGASEHDHYLYGHPKKGGGDE